MNNKYLKNKIIRDYIKYKKENPDYQIPIIKDRPFKAVCKTIRIYIDKIIAYFIGIDYKLIKNSYFIDTELPQEIYKNKVNVLDLLLQVSENLYINLEANNYDTPSSVMKNVLYGYRLVLSKQATGKDYIPIEFIQLNFDNCSLPFNKKIVNRFVTQEEDLKIRHPYTGKTIRIALDKLEDNPYNETISDWQMRALKLLLSDSIKYSRELAGDYEDLNEVVDFMEKFSSIEEELMYVNKEEEEQKLKNTDINIARQEGLVTGRIEGKIEGKIEGALVSKKETIKNLTYMKMPSKQIAIAVNMPEKEVIKIQEEFAIKVPVEK